MATARRDTRKIKKMVETEVEEDIVVLTMSQDEAQHLREILGRVVFNIGHTEIKDALDGARIGFNGSSKIYGCITSNW